MTVQARLPFELDVRAEAAALTAHGGVPLSGAAAVLDASVAIKRRKRGLTSSQLVEGLFSLWAAGGKPRLRRLITTLASSTAAAPLLRNASITSGTPLCAVMNPVSAR